MTVQRLTYRGDGAFRPGLPARDIDRSDLEALGATQKRDIADIVAEAVGSGLYVAVEVADDPAAAAASDADGSARNDADPLTDPATTRPMLVETAATLGLAVASKDTKAAIVEAIRAEQMRRADEAAAQTADDASSSGAGTGDEGTPADDPAAAAASEAGSPPSDGAGA